VDEEMVDMSMGRPGNGGHVGGKMNAGIESSLTSFLDIPKLIFNLEFP
jgi:hypothetical protein